MKRIGLWVAVAVAIMAAVAAVIASGWRFRQAPSTATATPHKCMQDGKVLYSNQPCPGAMREQALTAGTLSVLPAAKESKPAAAATAATPGASATPLLRRLAGPDETAEIKERRIEQAIGR